MALDLVSIAQPHYIPGYTGHCPEYKYRIGDTYGSTTHKILLDPSVQHSERLVLSDRTADDFQIFRPPQTDIDIVDARFRNGDPVYKHPMIPGYEGFLPRLNAHFGQRYTVAATEGLSEFQRLQMTQRAARNQLERVVDLQAGKGQPWDLVDRFSATAEFKLPLVAVRPECAGILRDLPVDEAKLSPASHSRSPYFMNNDDPEKFIKKGEYACPVWSRSAHTKLVDPALNETCRIITGCIKPTPVQMLYPLAGIAPPDVRRTVSSSIERTKLEVDIRHPIYKYPTVPQRLKSRKNFLKCVDPIQSEASQARLGLWREGTALPDPFVPPMESLPPGQELPRPIWRCLNRLRTQVGRSKDNLFKWGYTDGTDLNCECGVTLQTKAHLVSCPFCPDTCTRTKLMNAAENAIRVAKFWAGKI